MAARLMSRMNRRLLILWFFPLIFMGIAFYVLFSSNVSTLAKLVFSVVPILIWLLGGLEIYRENREEEKEASKEEEILEEAKRILNTKNEHEEKSE